MRRHPIIDPLVTAGFRAALMLLPVAASAQEPAPSFAEPGDELTVTLVTMGYGDEIWQNFGHNAIWIHDALRGTDAAYNYGVFDFDEPGFLTRFLKGQMLYQLAVFDYHRMVDVYRQENRTITLQRLNLTASQKSGLQQFLQTNALPENRYYRYDYFRDNCSTRVRDALDRVLGGSLHTSLSALTNGRTYRGEALRLTSADVPIYTGIDLGLGPFTDRPLTLWDESFVPMRFRDHIRGLSVTGADGRALPLVAEETVLYQATRQPPPDAPPTRLPDFIMLGIAAAILVWLLGRFSDRSGAVTVVLAVLVFVWALLNGVLGVALAGLWVFTDHVAAYRNENLLQTNPLALALAVAGPGALLFGRARRLATNVAVILAASSLVGVLLLALPMFHQHTTRMIGLLLPIHLSVAWVFVRRRAPAPSPSPRRDTGERAWRAREARAQGRHR